MERISDLKTRIYILTPVQRSSDADDLPFFLPPPLIDVGLMQGAKRARFGRITPSRRTLQMGSPCFDSQFQVLA